jgi:hypothetical protein
LNRRSPAIVFLFVVLSGLAENRAHAGWKDEIGFTRLKALASPSLPTASLQGLTQVEASRTDPPVYTFVPDSLDPDLTGNVIINQSASTGSGISSHATHVAENFYGNGSLMPGIDTVDLYEVNNWLGSGFLNRGTGSQPKPETRAVQNHSWVGSLGSASDIEVNRRLDFAIDRDGFVCVVGLHNEAAKNPLPNLLCQTYNAISVGRDDGNHSLGPTTLDEGGGVGLGRVKPDIVAPSASPENATSWTTPMVASAAGLLHAKLSAAPISLPIEDRPRVVKALLLASATKNTVPGWDNTSIRPLDERYGAGELNIHHAWLAMSAGRKNSGNTTHGIRGWAAESVSTTNRTYFFTVPASPVPTPFCAALTWHRVITDGIPNPNQWGNLGASLADLNLRLYQASGFTVGGQIAESASTVDNVELIYQPSLAPGSYALEVRNASGAPFALAWHSLPAVTVAATQPTAREIDGSQGLVTITRTGDTALPMQVPLIIGGSAIPGTHYQALPTTVTIPAGQSSLALQVTPVSDSLEQGNRTVTVALADDFALVRDAAESAVVTIQDKPSFDDWRIVNFTAPELALPAISGETADPDGDHLANLIEYALGLHPKTPDVSPVNLLEPANHLTLATAKYPDASGITWGAEVSADLTSWTPADIVTNDSSTFTARDNILITGAERRFIRLKITRP